MSNNFSPASRFRPLHKAKERKAMNYNYTSSFIVRMLCLSSCSLLAAFHPPRRPLYETFNMHVAERLSRWYESCNFRNFERSRRKKDLSGIFEISFQPILLSSNSLQAHCVIRMIESYDSVLMNAIFEMKTEKNNNSSICKSLSQHNLRCKNWSNFSHTKRAQILFHHHDFFSPGFASNYHHCTCVPIDKNDVDKEAFGNCAILAFMRNAFSCRVENWGFRSHRFRVKQTSQLERCDKYGMSSINKNVAQTKTR